MKLLNTTLTLSLAAISGLSGAYALTDVESASVEFMKQEEKFARDVYTHMASLYDVPIFSNIARAEQKHMNAVDYIMQINDMVDKTPAATGEFTYPELTDLYNQLIAKGALSLLDALEVGVLIEETDIEDLETDMNSVTDPTLATVYQNLLRGSYNHLRAFNNNIVSGGTVSENLQMGTQRSGNGQLLLSCQGGNPQGTNGSGTNLTIQAKTAGGKGPWRNVGGNGNGTGANAGSNAVCNQIAVNQPANNTLYRARQNAGNQVTYSNAVCSELVSTPWPDGTFLGQGWFATWMGNLFIGGNYPQVYSERFGWMTIESFSANELWFVDADGNRWMTTEDRYPSVFDPNTGEWE